MLKELDYMIERFPEYRARVTELYNNNEDFKSLCEDYWQCRYNLSRLTGNDKKDPRIENCYKMLNLTLEQEVLNFFNK